MIKKATKGFWAPFEGLRFLAKKRVLWKYVVIPFLVNVGVLVGLGILFLVLFSDLVGIIIPEGDAWYWAILRAVLWIVGSFLAIVLFLVSFTAVGTAIASPFNDLLSEQVEKMFVGLRPDSRDNLWSQARRSARSILESMKHVAFYLAGSGIIALIGLTPAVGTFLSLAFGTLWTLLFLAIEFGDYYLARHWISFRTRWQMVLSEKWACLGFGAGCAVLFMIPLMNLLLMPGAVVGGTLLWLELRPKGGEIGSQGLLQEKG